MSKTKNKFQVPLLILVGFVLGKSREGICEGFWGGEISVGLKAVLREVYGSSLSCTYSVQCYSYLTCESSSLLFKIRINLGVDKRVKMRYSLNSVL